MSVHGADNRTRSNLVSKLSVLVEKVDKTTFSSAKSAAFQASHMPTPDMGSLGQSFPCVLARVHTTTHCHQIFEEVEWSGQVR